MFPFPVTISDVPDKRYLAKALVPGEKGATLFVLEADDGTFYARDIRHCKKAPSITRAEQEHKLCMLVREGELLGRDGDDLAAYINKRLWTTAAR